MGAIIRNTRYLTWIMVSSSSFSSLYQEFNITLKVFDFVSPRHYDAAGDFRLFFRTEFYLTERSIGVYSIENKKGADHD
ncbi:MAG: hypothetical protein COB20_12055 [SAR86 cluster bacterium]|uniref:Uncharacterized protein n=1 Tax=SAR86 cluster bacterium TaxID=2030880 RepID=A0A2A4X135_9GAMM|nr:MAG: hypothetical protein COB20_12055 [SAR86 cluster bacterium]